MKPSKKRTKAVSAGTERKRGEEALRQREAKLREALLAAIVESSDDAIIGKALDGTIVTWNRGAELLFGYRADEVIGKPVSLLAPPDRPDEVPRLLERIRRGERITHFETVRVHKGGRRIAVSLTLSPIKNPRGEVVGAAAIARDITQRRQAEEALRQSEEKYRSIVLNIPEVVWTADSRGRVVFISPNIEKVAGYTPEELYQGGLELFFQAIHPDDVQAIKETFEAAFRDQQPRDVECRGPHKEGRWIWLRVWAMGAYEKDGVQYLQGLLSDITERKRLEAALESAARLPQENPDPVMRLSQGRIIDFANPSAHDLLRIWGRNLGEEVPPEIAEPAIAALGSGARRQAEVTYGGRTYLANLCPVPAANYVNLYAQNITARKRAEEEQRESEERFRSLVENLTVGIYRTTPQGRILMANLTLVRMLGYENFEELAARNLEEQGFSPDYPRRAFREHIERDGEVKGLEAAWTRRDGSVVFLRESARVVRGESGNVLWYEGMVEDITERRRAEEERQRSLEQLRALAAQQQSVREEERKRLAREIHDQLGQALTAIKIDLSFLLRELPAGEKPPAKRTASILQLVDEAIRAVRRISTELRPGILDDLGLVATLEWAGEDFQARTGTRCRLDLPREDIAVDPERATAIFRILQETLTNVARHADASQVEVRLAKEDGDLTLEVHDNGKGIPEDKLSNGESLGILGMRERALLLGGEIIISGAPGQGTIVRVRIPEARRT